MISSGRCTSGGGGRTAVVVSKDCRTVVHGGGVGAAGYVNHCEQALDAKNEVVMATNKIAVATAGGNPTVTAVAAVHNHVRSKSYSADEFRNLQQLRLADAEMIENLIKAGEQKDKTIVQLSNELELTKQKLDEANQHIAEIVAEKESLDVLPFTPVSSTCSSGMGDLSSAELPEQQDVKPKKRRSRQAALKQPNPDQLEPNHQPKRQRTRSARAKSTDIGEIQEVSLITVDKEYYTCLGNYDPLKDDPEIKQIPKNKGIHEEDLKNLEIPSWRIKTYSSWYSMEGTENMSDDIFENRHSRLELWERKRKRWDMQRLRELRRIEYLKEGRNKHHLQHSIEIDKEELTSLLPNPANIKAIEVIDKLPVSAFGSNLYIKKKHEMFTFYHSKWCNDGSQKLLENNERGHRSSGCGKLYDTT